MQGIDDKIEQFFSVYPTRHYNQRHILLYTGDFVRNIYYIREGTVKEYGISSAGEEFILNVFKEHSFFPMSHALNNTKTNYFFEAQVDITVVEAPAEDVIDFLKANPDVVYDLLCRVYRGAEGILGRMALLMAGSAQLRLVYELIIEARRFGKVKDTTGIIHISEKVLGARSGLSRETINREIHKLKEQGLIIVHKNNIEIPDLPSLEALLSE